MTSLFQRSTLAVAAFGLTIASAARAQDDADAPIQYFINKFDGEAKYPADLENYPYLNPEAPIYGEYVSGVRGGFNDFNSLNGRGDDASGLGLLSDSLLGGAADELDTSYGVLAESIQMPKDRAWVTFKIRDEARWANGTPVTAEDVKFTFDFQFEKGWPGFKDAYAMIESIEVLDGNRVKFSFTEDNSDRNVPFTIGGETIIPRYFWEDLDPQEIFLDIYPEGSGEYRIKEHKDEDYIVYERRADYWGNDFPWAKGSANFQTIRYRYYNDVTTLRNAIKVGEIDMRAENQMKAWVNDYKAEDIPAIAEGVLVKKEFDDNNIQNTQAMFFNLQREKFQDRRVREAIGLAFDFEFTNKQLFYGRYIRQNSHLENSQLEATGVASGRELEILQELDAKYPGQLPETVFGAQYAYPETDGTGNNRDNLRAALDLFSQAGWNLEDGKLVDADGEQFALEIIDSSPDSERYILPWVENLERLGIAAEFRLLDPTQWIEKIRSRDFEMTDYVYRASYTPGTQMRYYWSSELAATPGSIAFHGYESDVLDDLIARLTMADNREELNQVAKALDRVLTSEHLVVLEWYYNKSRMLYWDKFGTIDHSDDEDFLGGPTTGWWIDEALDITLDARRDAL
ncbi:extracellular solute-binding protein [Alphaproteobacteria bacterium]|nr:extracellular solute-binding protein [Alphaproteobacteria bacterium]